MTQHTDTPPPCPGCGRPADKPINRGGVTAYAYSTIYDADMVLGALEAGAELDEYDMRKLLRAMRTLQDALLRRKRKVA